MADPSAVSIFVNTLSLIGNAIISVPWLRLASAAATAIIWPLRLLALPFIWVGRLLLVVFAPLLYVAAFVLSFASAILSFLATLEPLYTFLAVAASVGIFTGLVMAVSSNIITFQLGMQEQDQDEDDLYVVKRKPQLDAFPTIEDESSSYETEWHWPDVSPSRRRPTSGLLSQTIHEEEDDDSDVAF